LGLVIGAQVDRH